MSTVYEEKDKIPYYAGMFSEDIIKQIALCALKDFEIKTIAHSTANEFVTHHHYLKRKIYIARNVSYGLFAKENLVGVAMFGYPVWTKYPNLCPPNKVDECPELIRLSTLGGLPRNMESYFLSRCFKKMLIDWEKETGVAPKYITSFCDTAFGFSGALYKALNFKLFRVTKGRPTNPGETHGKWRKNNFAQKAEKQFFILSLIQ